MVFNEYHNFGINNREDLIIPKTVWDANPLTCNGETFIVADPIENWIVLK